MSSFEDYLKDNRHKLKQETDSRTDLWNNIENRLYRQKQYKFRILTGIAASLALILALAAFMKVQFYKSENQTTLPLYSYSKAYGDAEREYISDVAYKVDLLNESTITANKLDDLNSFLTGIQALDEAYEGYSKIIEEEGCDEIMMELIIDNYKRKLELLERLQDEILKINYYEKELETKQTKLSI